MARDDELRRFVRQALEQGESRERIQAVLHQAGWRYDRIDDALNGFAELPFTLPVPRPRPYLSAREAFLYLLMFTTLYISAFNLGQLLFQYIDLAFPDPATGERAAATAHATIRWSVANLAVAFPVFLFIAWRVSRAIAADPAKAGSMVRRWLTYLTLYAAAAVLIGDLVVLLHNLLAGELSVRFGLKVATVAAIAGTAFGYYLWELRTEETEVTA